MWIRMSKKGYMPDKAYIFTEDQIIAYLTMDLSHERLKPRLVSRLSKAGLIIGLFGRVRVSAQSSIYVFLRKFVYHF